MHGTKGSKVLVIAVALLGAMVLFGTSLRGNAVRYYTVDSYLARKDEVGDRFIQLQGAVVPGSIRYDPVALELSFQITKNGSPPVPVFHRGIKPDVLNDGLDVLAEGHMGADGVFQARKLTVKCPSRYTSQQMAAGQER